MGTATLAGMQGKAGWLGSALALAWGLVVSPAQAQSEQHNATTESSDAFGHTVGNERSGLYSQEEVRGFNPSEAGNNRMQGLYFDFAGFLPTRLTEGSTVRVGLAAQRYPFPAPSGLIDYTLEVPGAQSEFEVEIDNSGGVARGFGAQTNIKLALDGERFGVALGAGMREANRPEGGEHKFRTWAALAAFRPAPGTEFIAFSSVLYSLSNDARATYYPVLVAPPPEVERGKYLGLDWTGGDNINEAHGAMAKIALAPGWRIHAGLFLSVRRQNGTFADLLQGVNPQGQASRVVIAEDGNRDRILSGEFRLIREWQSGRFDHTLTASLRGRAKNRLFGGGARLNLGTGPIDQPEFWPSRPPPYTLGAKSTDRVRQLYGGLSYNLLWQGGASLDLGISKGTYSKRIDFAGPDLADLEVRDAPLLWNVAASVSLGRNVILFGGMSRGQEDAVIAPDIAINRAEAPPAIRTRQVEAGLRVQLTPDLSLVTSVFEISRPYYNLDTGLRYRELGRLTNRGLEVSLTGKLAPGLTLVGGLLLADPKISGEAVASGQIGERPVGQVRRRVVANLDWRSRGGTGPLSLDLNVESFSSRVGNAANTLTAPPRTNVNLGARYRFKLAGTALTLRPQVMNLFDNYGWAVNPSGGFVYTPKRAFNVALFVNW